MVSGAVSSAEIFDVAGRKLRGGELQARGVDSSALAEEMNVQRALRKRGIRGAVRTNGVVRIGLMR